MTVRVIRTDGREETHDLPKNRVFTAIERLIGAELLDTVNLRDGRVMLVDDNGYETESIEHQATDERPFTIEVRPIRARKPVNEKATALYLSVCRPGTTHQVVGDVAVCHDQDFTE